MAAPDQLFLIANAVALVGWIALLLAPLNRRLALRVARGVGAALAVTYTVLFAVSLDAARGLADEYSLASIGRFFADPRLALIGWVHYLAFDLWVGAWEVEAADRAGMRHWLVVPALLLTFLVGPVGLAVFLASRTLARRS